ncbi:MAG TPA: hypothetical protein VIK89_04840 [Cytophagaceae bacterium]
MNVRYERDCTTITPFKQKDDLRCAPNKEIYKGREEKNYYNKNKKLILSALERNTNSNDNNKEKEDKQETKKEDIDYCNYTWEELLIKSMNAPVVPFNWDNFKE